MGEKRMSAVDNSQGTVTRVIQMLGHLAENRETSIKQFSQSLGLAPSTCHRLLDLLAREGMVERDPNGRRYRVGVEYLRISALAQKHFDIRLIALPFLRTVVEQCNETCVLSLYDKATATMSYAEKVDSSRLLRYQLSLDKPLSLLWGASGRSILAFLPEDEIRNVHANEKAAPASEEPLPPFAVLQDQLRKIREDGFAISFGQKIAGAVGIMAPVFGADGSVLGSLGVTIPETRAGEADMPHLTRFVADTADRLSAALGCPRNESGHNVHLLKTKSVYQ